MSKQSKLTKLKIMFHKILLNYHADITDSFLIEEPNGCEAMYLKHWLGHVRHRDIVDRLRG